MPHARPARPSLFRFGVYELDLRAGELSAAGHRIDLPDQPFAVLSVLLEHAGQLVTREELRARLWPNATPLHFEQGVDYAIRRLREALEDDTSDPEFIETIPRRGYRFIAPVEAVAAGVDDRSGGEAVSTPEHDAALPAADDRYELLEMIGAGGMGEVYRARDTRLDRDVAVKFLPPWLKEDPHALRRFRREAHAAAALNHPNILAVHDLVLLNGAACIVCELLEGRTLRQDMSGGRLGLADAFGYSNQILDGLVAAHEKGIVHRDLKPENVFITDDGPLKILDFGLARLANPSPDDDSAATTGVTNRNEVLGTPAYMSPEQAQAEAVDARSDIFSFGVLLYEMLAGERPFAGQTHASVVSAILRDTPRAIEELNPAVPRELSRLIRRCLQKDPRLRFQNTRDLRNELIEIAQEWQAGGLAPTAAPLPAVRRPWLYLLGGVLLVVTIGAVAWFAGLGDWVRARMAGGGPGTSNGASIEAPSAVTAAPGREVQPALSRDGSVVAYVSDESGNTDVYTVGVSGGNRVQITSDAAIEERPSWFPDGTAIAFASNRGGSWSIWRAPAPLGGSPSLVIENGREPAVSPDGTRIAFVRPDGEGCGRIHLAETGEPSSARRLVPVTRGPCRDESWPAWSPDGREIVFAGDRRLWVASLSGGDPRSVTDQGEYDVEPVWADQRTILFCSFRKGTYALWRVPASGLSPPERLTTGAGPERSPSVSQDGLRLAFSSFWENFDLVIRDMKTGQEEAYGTTRNEISPQFSPDGQSVLFAVDRQAGSGTELRLQLLASWKPSGPASQLTVDSGSSSSPQFSPDGKWIAYYRVLDGRRSIWLMPSGGGQPVRFGVPPSPAPEAADETDPAWSPDGYRLAFVSSRDGRKELWAAAINNQGKRVGEATRLTSGPGDKELPAWAPDGRWVSFVTGDPAIGEVGIVAADSTGQRLLTRGAGAVFARWIPGTNSLAVTGTWGGSRLVVRRVEVSGRTPPSSVPLLEIGEPSDAPMFDISRDGGHIVFCRSRKVGDILVSALRPPR